MNKNFVPLRLRALVLCALASTADGQVTTRVSVSASGAQGNSRSAAPSVSELGRFVVFQSDAGNLVAGDTNGVSDIFVHDRQTRNTARVSVDSSGAQANGASHAPKVSANGRFVVFQSSASNLVTGDSNGNLDVFVRDMQTGSTERASVQSDGSQIANRGSYSPSISGDGRIVAFISNGQPAPPYGGEPHARVYVRDRVAQQTIAVSVSPTGVAANGSSADCAVSADGAYVAFTSYASNLVSPFNPSFSGHIYVRDLAAGVTTLMTVSPAGVQGNGTSAYPSISADGRYVAFASGANNLVPGDTNVGFDVFVRDRATGLTSRESVRSDGTEAYGYTEQPFPTSVSDDGRYVAFGSSLDLAPDVQYPNIGCYLRDRSTGKTTLLATAGVSAEWLATSVSGNGAWVAFDSVLPLDPGDDNAVSDVFMSGVLPVLPPQPFPADVEPAAIAIANFDVDLDVFKRPDLAVVNAASNSVSLLDNNGVVGQLPSFAPPSPERTFAVGAGPTAAATGNLDDNPYPDLVVANTMGGTVSVLLGSPIAGFVPGPTLPAPGAPRALSLADLDRDGWQDVLVARRDADAISIFRNLGGGKFAGDQPQQVPPGGRPNGIGSGDLDNDKDVDPVITITGSGHVAVHLNISPGPGVIALAPAQLFSVGTGDPRPVSVMLRDFDFDGFLDVACANKGVGTVAVLRNLGLDTGGAWLGLAEPVSFPVGELPVSVGADNVYGFGFPDLFTANAFVGASNESSVSLLKNVSSGPGDIAFEPEVRVGVPPLAAHVAAADVNLDNRLDLAVATGFDAGSIRDSARGASPGVAAVLAGASPSVALAPCDGDANGDRVVDFLDLNIVLSFYGQSGPALPGDLNTDGVVDFLDLNIVLSAFGAAC